MHKNDLFERLHPLIVYLVNAKIIQAKNLREGQQKVPKYFYSLLGNQIQ